MKVNASIDLDDLWTGSDWDETVAGLIRDELRSVIKTEIKKQVKADRQLQKVITAYRKKALEEAEKALGL